jgi:hypothetical protein
MSSYPKNKFVLSTVTASLLATNALAAGGMGITSVILQDNNESTVSMVVEWNTPNGVNFGPAPSDGNITFQNLGPVAINVNDTNQTILFFDIHQLISTSTADFNLSIADDVFEDNTSFPNIDTGNVPVFDALAPRSGAHLQFFNAQFGQLSTGDSFTMSFSEELNASALPLIQNELDFTFEGNTSVTSTNAQDFNVTFNAGNYDISNPGRSLAFSGANFADVNNNGISALVNIIQTPIPDVLNADDNATTVPNVLDHFSGEGITLEFNAIMDDNTAQTITNTFNTLMNPTQFTVATTDNKIFTAIGDNGVDVTNPLDVNFSAANFNELRNVTGEVNPNGVSFTLFDNNTSTPPPPALPEPLLDGVDYNTSGDGIVNGGTDSFTLRFNTELNASALPAIEGVLTNAFGFGALAQTDDNRSFNISFVTDVDISQPTNVDFNASTMDLGNMNGGINPVGIHFVIQEDTNGATPPPPPALPEPELIGLDYNTSGDGIIDFGTDALILNFNTELNASVIPSIEGYFNTIFPANTTVFTENNQSFKVTFSVDVTIDIPTNVDFNTSTVELGNLNNIVNPTGIHFVVQEAFGGTPPPPAEDFNVTITNNNANICVDGNLTVSDFSVTNKNFCNITDRNFVAVYRTLSDAVIATENLFLGTSIAISNLGLAHSETPSGESWYSLEGPSIAGLFDGFGNEKNITVQIVETPPEYIKLEQRDENNNTFGNILLFNTQGEADQFIALTETNTTTPPAQVQVFGFDADQNTFYNGGDQLVVQFPEELNVTRFENNASLISAPLGLTLGNNFTAFAALNTFDINNTNLAPVLNDGNFSNTFILNLGIDANITEGNHITISQVMLESKEVNSTLQGDVLFVVPSLDNNETATPPANPVQPTLIKIPNSQKIPFSGLKIDGNGIAGWEVGHTSAILQPLADQLSLDSIYAHHQISSRDKIDNNNAYAMVGDVTRDLNGFVNLTQEMNSSAIPLSEIGIRFDSSTLGNDSDNIDWHEDINSSKEWRIYQASPDANATIYIQNHPIISCPLPNIYEQLSNNDVLDITDDNISGYSDFCTPIDITDINTPQIIKDIATALLTDINNAQIRFRFDSIQAIPILEAADGFVDPTNANLLGGYYEITNGYLELNTTIDTPPVNNPAQGLIDKLNQTRTDLNANQAQFDATTFNDLVAQLNGIEQFINGLPQTIDPATQDMINQKDGELDQIISQLQGGTPPANQGPLVRVAEFDNNQNFVYDLDDTVFIQFQAEVTTSGIISGITSLDGNKTLGTTGYSVHPIFNDADLNGIDLLQFGFNPIVSSDVNRTSTFAINIGQEANISTGDNILIPLASIVENGTNFYTTDVIFPLLALANDQLVFDQIQGIRNELNSNAADIPPEIFNNLIQQLNDVELLVQGFTSETSDGGDVISPSEEEQIKNALEELKIALDQASNEDFFAFGADAFSITGQISLPDGVVLVEEEPVDPAFDPALDPAAATATPPAGDRVFIDLIDANTGEFVSGTMANADGSFTIYYPAIEQDQNRSFTIKVNADISHSFSSFYLDAGTDGILNATSTQPSDDALIPEQDVQYVPNADGFFLPQVNSFNVDAAGIIEPIYIPLSEKDASVTKLRGIVKVGTDFKPGEVYDANGGFAGFKMVNVSAIDLASGAWYSTEISRVPTDDNNDSYAFEVKIPHDGNYSLRIEKFSDENGQHSFLEAAYDDEVGVDTNVSDHSFDGDEDLVSNNNIPWIELTPGHWVPDPAKTGYFEVVGNTDLATVVDFTTYGTNFFKVEGSVTSSATFDLTDPNSHMNIDLIDAQTGAWIGGAPVICDSGVCSYSLILGDDFSDTGYLIRINQDHFDPVNPQNNFYNGFFYDSSLLPGNPIVPEFDVRHKEVVLPDGFIAFVPDVAAFIDTDDTTKVKVVDIDFSGFTPPTTRLITGQISGIPANANWTNVHLYNPITFIGTGRDVNSDGSFEVEGVKDGKYLVELNFDVQEANGNYRHFNYFVFDDDGDFSSGTTLIDSNEVQWTPYDSNGTSLKSLANDPTFNWATVAYWAPEAPAGLQDSINVDSDEVVNAAVPVVELFSANFSIRGLPASNSLDFNMFVPEKPFGRWEQLTSDVTGEANVTIEGIKAGNKYFVSTYIHGLGDFWVDGNSLTLKDNVQWVGTQNGAVCADALTPPTCNFNDFENPVSWEPNVAPLTVDENENFAIALPNDRAVLTANFNFDASYAGKLFFVNAFEHQTSFDPANPGAFAFDEYVADVNGDINMSLSVKQANNYRVELWSHETYEGFVVDLGDDNATGGAANNADTLQDNQNSWFFDEANGIFGPKVRTLVNVQTDVNLGTLTPPTLKTLTFTVTNRTANEGIFIDVEKIDATTNLSQFEWYGNGNYNPQTNSFDENVTIKVPDGDYRVLFHPSDHRGGMLIKGTGAEADANETIASGETITQFDWNLNKADKISVAGDQAITIELPSAASLHTISGNVNLNTLTDASGWIDIFSPTVGGNWSEVNASGGYSVAGLKDASDYEIFYGSNDGTVFLREVANINGNNVDVNLTQQSTFDTYTINVTNGGSVNNANIIIALIDYETGDLTTWEVLDDVNALTTSFTIPRTPDAGHAFAIAIGVKTVVASGATTIAGYEAIQLDGSTNGVIDIALDGITNTGAPISVIVTKQ